MNTSEFNSYILKRATSLHSYLYKILRQVFTAFVCTSAVPNHEYLPWTSKTSFNSYGDSSVNRKEQMVPLGSLAIWMFMGIFSTRVVSVSEKTY